MNIPILQEMFSGESPKSIFEVGVANGGLLKDLYDSYPDLVVGGFDRNASDLGKSKELFSDQADNFFIHDALKIPWPIADKSYDIVFTCGVLIYLTDPFPAIKEMIRIAKHKIILAEFHEDKLDEWGVNRGEKDHHGWRIIRNYKKVFKKLNLSITLENTNMHKSIIKCQINRTD